MVVDAGAAYAASRDLVLESLLLQGVCEDSHTHKLTGLVEMDPDNVHLQGCYARRWERGSTHRGARRKFWSGTESR